MNDDGMGPGVGKVARTDLSSTVETSRGFVMTSLILSPAWEREREEREKQRGERT